MPNQLLTGGGRKDFGKKNKGAFATKKKTVTTAGTAVNVAAQVIPDGYAVVIKALSTNTDTVHIANVKADAEDDAKSYPLEGSESIEMFLSNFNEIWVDANVNGEGISVAVETD